MLYSLDRLGRRGLLGSLGRGGGTSGVAFRVVVVSSLDPLEVAKVGSPYSLEVAKLGSPYSAVVAKESRLYSAKYIFQTE